MIASALTSFEPNLITCNLADRLQASWRREQRRDSIHRSNIFDITSAVGPIYIECPRCIHQKCEYANTSARGYAARWTIVQSTRFAWGSTTGGTTSIWSRPIVQFGISPKILRFLAWQLLWIQTIYWGKIRRNFQVCSKWWNSASLSNYWK